MAIGVKQIPCERCLQLKAENERLKEFARDIIKGYCWDLLEPDGGDAQELAERLGLIEPHIVTAEEVDTEFDDFDVGDTIYKFTEILSKP